MKEIFWVFRHMGFVTGILFTWECGIRQVRRLLNKLSRKHFPIRFEDLSDHDAQMTAWTAGLPGWERLTRQELNQAWNDFISKLTVH